MNFTLDYILELCDQKIPIDIVSILNGYGIVDDLGGLVVSVLDTGTKLRGFDPDRGRWIFKGDKNP
jgi:hypothetical protein